MHHFGFLNSKCALAAPASPEHAAWGMEQCLKVAPGDGETAAGGNGLNDFAALEDRIRATVDAVYAIIKDIIETPASKSEKENNR